MYRILHNIKNVFIEVFLLILTKDLKMSLFKCYHLKNAKFISLILVCCLSFAPSGMSMMLQIEEEAPKCKKLHLYKIQNVKNNAHLYLLGSNHAVGLSSLPTEAVDLLVSSNRLFVEIYDNSDNEESSVAEFQLIIKEFENRLESKGFFRREVGVGFLDKYEHGSTETKKGWFDLVKDKISPQLLKLMDEHFHVLKYENAESFYNHYHPATIPLLKRIFDEALGDEPFLEEENGMDVGLAEAFHQLGKPVYGLETDLDRILIEFDGTLKEWLSSMPSPPSYSFSDIENLVQHFEERFKEDTEESNPDSFVENSQKIEESITAISLTFPERYQIFAELRTSCLQNIQTAKLEKEIKEPFVRQLKELLTEEIQPTRILWESQSLKEDAKLAEYCQKMEDRHNLEMQALKQQLASDMRILEAELETVEANLSESLKQLEKITIEEAKLAEEEKMLNKLRELPTFMDSKKEYLNGDITERLQACDESYDVIPRNKNWFPTFLKHLEEELEISSSVVGVEHLYGPEGLLNMFANIPHYTITRWDSETLTFKPQK